MMSSNRGDYGSAAEWLSALRLDKAWLIQQQRLESSTPADANVHQEDALRRIGRGDAFEYWGIYGHQVEPVISEVWEIAELSLPKLKIQAIGMLSMEWLERHVPTGRQVSEKTKKPVVKKKPEKPRETMTFKRKGSVTEGHLTTLHSKLTEEGWIDGIEGDFKALFSGVRDEACTLTWLGKYGNGTLVELFRQLVCEGLVIVPKGYTLPNILEGHFKDQEGKWLTRLDKGDKAHDKAQPVIQECIDLLKMSVKQLLQNLRGDMMDEDEDFQSKYDPYDHQDLNIHKW